MLKSATLGKLGAIKIYQHNSPCGTPKLWQKLILP